jgi:hypothetical protein
MQHTSGIAQLRESSFAGLDRDSLGLRHFGCRTLAYPAKTQPVENVIFAAAAAIDTERRKARNVSDGCLFDVTFDLLR